MTEHFQRLEILTFIEGTVGNGDNEAISAHLQSCGRCFKVWEELVDTMMMLRDGEIAGHIDDDTAAADDFVRGMVALADEVEDAEQDARAADALFLQLAQEPVAKWEAMIGAQPHVCTSALAQRLVNASSPELDRNPDHALVLLRIAEFVAMSLDQPTALRWRGHVAKQQSNALRMAGRYEEAIDAALAAEGFYARLREPDATFEIGQARYTLAVTLFKMTRYNAARQALRSARTVLDEWGVTAPLAKVMMLEALIRIEEGDVVAARDALLELLPITEHFGQRLEIGRVRTNLAECNLRLGDLDAATTDAVAAHDIFRALGNVAEQTRSNWTLTMIQIARGEDAHALQALDVVASTYRALGMPGEAGFVGLDTAEFLLRWED